MLSRNPPPLAPHEGRVWCNIDRRRKGRGAFADGDRSIEGGVFGYHDRDYETNTNVMQPRGRITSVRTLADRVKWARENRGLSQEALAKLSGVAQTTIANLEAGIRKQPRRLLEIARALGVTPEWLLTGKNAHPREALVTIAANHGTADELGGVQPGARGLDVPVVVDWNSLGEVVELRNDETAVAAAAAYWIPGPAPASRYAKVAIAPDMALHVDCPMGTEILVEPIDGRRPRDRQMVLVRNRAGEVLLRGYRILSATKWAAVSNDPALFPTLPGDELDLLAVVIRKFDPDPLVTT